jgi:hypothetical protein
MRNWPDPLCPTPGHLPPGPQTPSLRAPAPAPAPRRPVGGEGNLYGFARDPLPGSVDGAPSCSWAFIAGVKLPASRRFSDLPDA